MQEWFLPLFTAGLGSCGFALIYHMSGYKLLTASLGGAVNWFMYLFLYTSTDNLLLSCFFATLATALLAEIFSRVLKAPVITFVVPMLIPMVPGGDLYYSTFALVRSDFADFAFYSSKLVREVGAMSLGMIVATCLVQTYMKIFAEIKKH